jgi:ABC-2 type transport system permease protein
MKRYLRLYAHFVRFSVSRAFEFRIDFFFRVFMDLAYYGINIAFYRVVYLHTAVLGGWNQDQAFVFMAGFLVVDAVTMTLFSNNLWFFPTAVNQGALDYYLLRPVSTLFFLSLRDFAANSFLNLLFAIGILAWSLIRLPGDLPWGSVAVYTALLGLGALLHYMVHLILVLPVFWTQTANSLHAMFYNFQRFMERPDRIYSGWVRKLLVTAMPFCLMASFPARAFFEGVSWSLALHFAAVLGLFWAGILGVWKMGVRAYSSASS